MAKYTFISEDTTFGMPPEKVIHEVNTVSLMDVVEHFERFLKGCGFVFDGHLDIVEENDCYGCCDDSPVEGQGNPFVTTMPGTTGGATLKFQDEECHGFATGDLIKTDSLRPVDSLEEKCKVCGLTRQQLGDHHCYDNRCGFKI